jgi:hypothetical protein
MGFMRIRYYCPDCLAARDFDRVEGGEFSCARCGRTAAMRREETAGTDGVETCAFCGGSAFFLQKDFDQRLGCLFIVLSLAAALFAGWKFGWIWFTPVLLATVVVDWIVATRVRPVTICYRCDAEYREGPINPRHRGYDPHVAERYAEKKTVRRMR